MKNNKTQKKEVHYGKDSAYCGELYAENFTLNFDNVTCKRCLSTTPILEMIFRKRHYNKKR